MGSSRSLLLTSFGMLVALAMVLPLFTPALGADSYPSRPVRIIAPEPPGGGSDTTSRLIAPKLTERLGNQVIVENRGGAGGVIGTEVVAKAAPDGYTLLLVSGKHTIQAVLEKLPYDAVKSFTPIAKLGEGPVSLCVNPSVPANSVKEVVTLAKQKPGQLVFGTAGLATTPHMAVELFKMMTDTDFKIVHFKGAGPAVIDLLGGHSHAMISSIAGTLPHIKSGKLRVLGTAGEKRSIILPDVPTIAETLPGYTSAVWFGILAPAGTPAPIIDKLNQEIRVILALDEVKKLFLNSGVEVDYLGPTEFEKFVGDEINRWGSVVKKANIKLEQ